MLEHLHIYSFRNISELELALAPEFNLICGRNGSGKTSILEALYYLTHLRSFRSSSLENIIQHGQASFTLYADRGENWSMGVQKPLLGMASLRLNGEPQSSIAAIAKQIPTVLVNSETFHLLDAGPEFRRQFMDWGVFHMEHCFLEAWRSYRHALKQRNMALKQGLSDTEIRSWSAVLLEEAEKIDGYRQAFFESWQPGATQLFSQLLSFEGLGLPLLTYRRGWPQGAALGEILEANLAQDRRLKYTQYGPHRADLEIMMGGQPAKEILSRGQQKLFVIAMKLSQGDWLHQHRSESCLYLLDDLPAELDFENCQKVLACIYSLGSQVVLTSIEAGPILETVQGKNTKMFHMEQLLEVKA